MNDSEKAKKPHFTWAQKRKALERHLLPFKDTLWILSVGEVLMAVGNGVIPYITGKFFDTLVKPHALSIPLFGEHPAWQILFGAWVLIQGIIIGINIYIDRKERRFTTQLEASVPMRAYPHLLSLPVSFHKKQRIGEITENLNRAGWTLNSIVSTTLSVVPQLLTVLIGIAISFSIYPILAVILLVGVAIYLIILARILPETAHYQEEGMRQWNTTMGDAQDAYTNFLTVKQAGAEEYESEKLRSTFTEKTLPLWYRMERSWSNLNQSQRIVVALTQASILFISVFLILQGKISVGDLIAFNAYAGMIIGPFVRIGGQWQNFQNGLIALARAETIFETPSEAYEPRGSVSLPDVHGDISFTDVHFSYEPGQAEVLKGITFEAKAGEVIALVGETGVGKSTTTDLIPGYYFPTAGTITIDGHDIRQVNLRDLRKRIAIVPQEVVLFNASIKENIRYGRPDATDFEIEEVARKAHADVFIGKFPMKYDQEVGERGIKLSVGQKQRIAIARAMLRNPRILILDEPTSALDAETEQYISRSFEELMIGRTTFVIAHRLSTVRKADKIIVLKDGKIVETGTHEVLMHMRQGVYRHFYELHIGLHE